MDELYGVYNEDFEIKRPSEVRSIGELRDVCLVLLVNYPDVRTEIEDKFKATPLDEKVSFAYEYLGERGLRPNSDKFKSSKSTKFAEAFRTQGNEKYREKEFKEALIFYSASVRSSLPNSTELSLAYANRSAVLFESDKFDLSLLDIGRALDINYPDKLKYKLYQRRGKCFMELGNHSEAKLSFQKSRNYLSKAEITPKQRSDLEEDLDKLVDKCNKCDQNNIINSVKSFPLPELPSRNSQIPNASDKIRLNYSPEMGRHLTSTQDIEPGEILAIEKPYASVLLRDYYHTHCSNCFIRNPAMIPCEKCTLLMFCNEECRNKSWFDFHQAECDLLPALLSLRLDKMEFLAVRILMITTKRGTELRRLFNDSDLSAPMSSPTPPMPFQPPNTDEDDIFESVRFIHSLEDNFSKRPVGLREAVTAAILMHAIKGENTFFRVNAKVDSGSDDEKKLLLFTGTLLLKYLCVVHCNRHPIFELVKDTPELMMLLTDQNVEIGAALYPLVSMANHSCDPNVVRHSYHNNVVLRAIQPIAKNEQIFDNYCSTSLVFDYDYHYAQLGYEDRNGRLKTDYFFECKCVACENRWPLAQDLRLNYPKYLHENASLEELQRLSEDYKTIEYKVQKLELSGALEFLYPCLSLLHRSIQRPCKEYFNCQELIKVCLAYQGNNYIPSKDGTIILPFAN